MRFLVRRPIQDELVSSVWVRTARRAGLPIGAVTAALLGRKWYPGFFQGGHLNELAGFVGSTAEVLLQDHTVFPYSSAFYSPNVLATARHAALSVGVRARAAGAATQGTSDMVRLRRWCPDCAQGELEAWGESVWRRAHNLPGVLLCLEHDTPLCESRQRTSGTGVWTTDLPHECGPGRQLAARPTPFLREMARESMAALRAPPADFSPNWYRSQLLDVGVLSAERDVNASGLVEWARRVAGPNLQLLGFRDADMALNWLPLMIRPRTDVPFVPMKHVFFRAVLRRHVEATGLSVDHVPSGPSARPMQSRDEAYARALRKLVQAHVRSRQTIRICDALAAVGCWPSFRHNRSAFPGVEREVLRLRRSRASARPLRSDGKGP